jgi:hypothetical protein
MIKEPHIIESFGDGADPASRNLGAIKEEYRMITPALPYFVRGVQGVLHLDCPLSHDWMFHGHYEPPVATGHVNPEAKRGRYLKEYIAFHSTSQSKGCRTLGLSDCRKWERGTS